MKLRFPTCVFLYLPNFGKCTRVAFILRKMLRKDNLKQGDKKIIIDHVRGYIQRPQMPNSFHIFALTQGTQSFLLFLFHSNSMITGFICINSLICITVFHLWKPIFIAFVEVRCIVVIRQTMSIYLIEFPI